MRRRIKEKKKGRKDEGCQPEEIRGKQVNKCRWRANDWPVGRSAHFAADATRCDAPRYTTDVFDHHPHSQKHWQETATKMSELFSANQHTEAAGHFKAGRQYLNLSQPYLTLSRRYLTKYALKSFKSSKIVASCYLRTQFESLVRSLSLECSRTFQECSRSHELIRDDYFWPRDVAVGPHFQPHFDR